MTEEKFTYTRTKLIAAVNAAYNQGFLDGLWNTYGTQPKKRPSLDNVAFIADHEIKHARIEEANND
mgnify:CR=1 FL=1